MGSELDNQADARATQRLTVLLATGPHIAGAGLRSLLLALPGIQLVADRDHGPEAIRAAERHKPSAILVDCDGISDETLEVLQRLRAASPDSRLLAFSDNVDFDRLRRACHAGMDGYVNWAAVTKETLGPLLAAVHAGFWTGSHAAVRALAAGSTPPEPEELQLTPEERMIVDALNAGLTPEEMREQVPLSPRTRQRAMKRLFERFGVHNAFMLGKRLADYDRAR